MRDGATCHGHAIPKPGRRLKSNWQQTFGSGPQHTRMQYFKIFLVLPLDGKTEDEGRRNKNRSCILQCPILLCQKDMNSTAIFEEGFCKSGKWWSNFFRRRTISDCLGSTSYAHVDKRFIMFNRRIQLDEEQRDAAQRTLYCAPRTKAKERYNYEFLPNTDVIIKLRRLNILFRVNYQLTDKCITASITHFKDGDIFSASSREPAISVRLHSGSDVSASENVGRLLAYRCLKAGIYFAKKHINDKDLENASEKVMRIFRMLNFQ
uniref:Uncharacterized protein n=1 Tax=Romanomermis culicivorax TaxID=13658 RepID=A0A915L515_ROMCU